MQIKGLVIETNPL